MTRQLIASWIAVLKDAGWMSVMGMVCIATFAVSTLVSTYTPRRHS